MAVDPNRDLEHRLLLMQETVIALQARVQTLERRQPRGRSRWVTAAALVGSAALMSGQHPAAQSVGQTVKAPFVVTDDAGKAIFRVMGASSGGQNRFELLSANGTEAVSGFENAGGGGGGLVARGASGNANNGIGFTHEADGTATFLATGADGRPKFKYSKEGLVATGPVTIVDAAGRKLIDMSDAGGAGGARGLHVYNTAGKGVASVFVVLGSDGGGVTALGAAGTPTNGIGFTHESDGTATLLAIGPDGKPRFKYSSEGLVATGPMTLFDAAGKGLLKVAERVSPGDARITIGGGDKGNVAVNVANAGGTAVAGLGEAGIGGGVTWTSSATGTIRAIVSGTGQIHVANDAGVTLATMVAEQTGTFTIRNPTNVTIAKLGAGQRGGILQLANEGGNATVEAGVLSDGVGVVRAYPLGNPALGLVGMPGTFIMGFGGKK
jgi:hypothetical protein